MRRAAIALCAVTIAASIVYLALDDSNNIRRNKELLKKCSVKPVTSASTPKLQWKKRAHTPWDVECDLVGVDDQRIYAGITGDHGIWSVWHNGAGFGEYTDEQAAKLKAESVAKELGDKIQCPALSSKIVVVDVSEGPTDRMRALLAATRATVWSEAEWLESESHLSGEDKARWPILILKGKP